MKSHTIRLALFLLVPLFLNSCALVRAKNDATGEHSFTSISIGGNQHQDGIRNGSFEMAHNHSDHEQSFRDATTALVYLEALGVIGDIYDRALKESTAQDEIGAGVATNNSDNATAVAIEQINAETAQTAILNP